MRSNKLVGSLLAAFFTVSIFMFVSTAGTATPTLVKVGTAVKTREGQDQQQLSPKDSVTRQKAMEAYLASPLYFEKNIGQTDSSVKYISRGSGYTMFLTPQEVVFSLADPATKSKSALPADKGVPTGFLSRPSLSKFATPKQMTSSVLRMRLSGDKVNTFPRMRGGQQRKSRVNYFVGRNQKKWDSEVPIFGKVNYEDVYPGIDMVYYGNQSQLEYDFVVKPGASPEVIQLSFTGAKELTTDTLGNLEIRLPNGRTILQHAPIVYQIAQSDESKAGRQRRQITIPSRYVVSKGDSAQKVTFAIGEYDHSKPLVIDPVLVYATYFGGNGEDYANGIAVDSLGNAYICGRTASTNFPKLNEYQANFGGSYTDAFVTKLSASGSQLLYSTYIGGSGNDEAFGIAVDSLGNAYVCGNTASVNFPKLNAYQISYGGGNNDAFVVKLSASGSQLLYSTYIGSSGVEGAKAIAIDSSGNAYICGQTTSTNFPRVNACQQNHGGGVYDAYAAKLSASGSQLLYSTYIGGDGQDNANGIAVDVSGNAYVVGNTGSTNFPTQNAYQVGRFGYGDGFITKLSASGSQRIYSTLLGGNNIDIVKGVVVDSSGNAYLCGQTSSTDFPRLNECQSNYGGGSNDAFVTRLSASGSNILYSTYLGGDGNDSASGIAIDSLGNAYIGGQTASTNFPTKNAYQPNYGGGTSQVGGAIDIFVSKLSISGSQLLYSTYLGGTSNDVANGIAIDSSGNAYVCGFTGTMIPNSLQFGSGGSGDVFVGKFATGTPDTNQGTDFWCAFPGLGTLGTTYAGPAGVTVGPPDLRIEIVGSSGTIGVVSVPNQGWSLPFTIPSTGHETILVPRAYQLSADVPETLEPNGVHITANQPVSVQGLMNWKFSLDGFLALPTPLLGKEYIVLADETTAFGYPGGDGNNDYTTWSRSQFAVVATENGTTVTITPSAGGGTSVRMPGMGTMTPPYDYYYARPAGLPFNITLNAGQVYQLRAPTGATTLSGTVISSDKPVAVLSGSTASNIPSTQSAANHLVELLPPVSRWSKEFLAMPFATRSAPITYRIIAAANNTNITITGKAGTTNITLNRGKVYNYNQLADYTQTGGGTGYFTSKPVSISASRPILVGQFAQGYWQDSMDNVDNSTFFNPPTKPTSLHGDPTFLLIPAVGQFDNAYNFVTPDVGFAHNRLNVIALTGTATSGKVLLDGVAVPVGDFTPIGTTGYSGARLSVMVGGHTLLSSDGTGLSATSYGFANTDAYGYPTGLRLPLQIRPDGGIDGDTSVPDAPIYLQAVAISTNAIQLLWTDNSYNETGFKIERRLASSQTWDAPRLVGPGTATYLDTMGLQPDTAYVYRVCAYNAVGSSGYSNEATATTLPLPPTAPTGFVATAVHINNATAVRVNLAWGDMSNNEAGFEIERATVADGTTGAWAQILTPVANAVSAIDTTTVSRKSYTYRLRAKNIGGVSDWVSSSVTTPDVKPNTPYALNATAISESQINVGWQDSSDNETGFVLEGRLSPSGSWQILAQPGAGVSTFSHTGLLTNTKYDYRVKASNAVGDSAYSDIASATTFPPFAETAPVLTAAPESTTSIKLTWTFPSIGQNGFKIERKEATGNFVPLSSPVGASARTWTDTGRTPGVTYTYRVRAYKSAQDGPWSNEASTATWTDGPLPTGIYLSKLEFATKSMRAGGTVTGTVTLNKPTTVTVNVQLTSTHASIVGVPSNVVILSGQTSASFTVTGNGSSSNVTGTYVTVVGSAGDRMQGDRIAMFPNIAPTAVEGLQAHPGNNIAGLTWLPYPEGLIKKYHVYRRVGTQQFTDISPTIDLKATVFADRNAVNGVTYEYKVTSETFDGLVDSGSVVTVTPTASAPTVSWRGGTPLTTGSRLELGVESTTSEMIRWDTVLDGEIGPSLTPRPQNAGIPYSASLDLSAAAEGGHRVQAIGFVGEYAVATPEFNFTNSNSMTDNNVPPNVTHGVGGLLLADTTLPVSTNGWTLRLELTDDSTDTLIRSWTGSGREVHIAWDGKMVDGSDAPEGMYALRVVVDDSTPLNKLSTVRDGIGSHFVSSVQSGAMDYFLGLFYHSIVTPRGLVLIDLINPELTHSVGPGKNGKIVECLVASAVYRSFKRNGLTPVIVFGKGDQPASHSKYSSIFTRTNLENWFLSSNAIFLSAHGVAQDTVFDTRSSLTSSYHFSEAVKFDRYEIYATNPIKTAGPGPQTFSLSSPNRLVIEELVRMKGGSYSFAFINSCFSNGMGTAPTCGEGRYCGGEGVEHISHPTDFSDTHFDFAFNIDSSYGTFIGNNGHGFTETIPLVTSTGADETIESPYSRFVRHFWNSTDGRTVSQIYTEAQRKTILDINAGHFPGMNQFHFVMPWYHSTSTSTARLTYTGDWYIFDF